MQRKEDARRVMRGNYAELWVGGYKIAEMTGFKAEVSKKYGDLDLCGDLWSRQRLQSVSGTGTIDALRVDSFLDLEEIAAVGTGVDPVYTIVSKIADPDTAGTERWAFYEVGFENITLADFTSKQFAKRNIKFHFAGQPVPLDAVTPQ